MKRLIIFISILSLTAFAEDDILQLLEATPKADEPASSTSTAYRTPLRKLVGDLNGEQQIFFQFIDQNDFERALYQWPEAFAQVPFAKTSDGIALHALLLYKNGLEVIALESLMKAEPKDLHSELVKEWKLAAPETTPAWSLAKLSWKSEWTSIFGEQTEIRIRAQEVFGSDRIDEIKALLTKTKPGSAERSLVEWQLVLALAETDTSESAKILAHLMKQENNPITPELMNMTAARYLYQKGFLDAAIKYYEKVPKKSDYWFEAQEETGWAYMRKGQANKAIAITKTLTVPLFVVPAGPQSAFLRSLGLLKVCDYPGVINSLKDFRTYFRPRMQNLISVADAGDHSSSRKAITELKKGYVTLHALRGDAQNLPRMVTRDRLLKQLVETEKKLEAEASQAGQLYSRSLAGGSAKVGFQGYFEELKKSIELRAHTARATTVNRVQEMARREIEEIGQILQKMHIVEAEVLQQTSLAERVIKDSSEKMALSQNAAPKITSNQLRFPDSQELWFDELTNYNVDVIKGCQAVKR